MFDSSSPYTEPITDLLQLLTDAQIISRDQQEQARTIAQDYLEQHSDRGRRSLASPAFARQGTSDFISINWNVDDVQGIAHDRNLQLTDEQCLDVLDYIESNHDTNYGISWNSLHFALDSMDFD